MTHDRIGVPRQIGTHDVGVHRWARKLLDGGPEKRIATKNEVQRTVVAATAAAGACRSLVIHGEGKGCCRNWIA